MRSRTGSILMGRPARRDWTGCVGPRVKLASPPSPRRGSGRGMHLGRVAPRHLRTRESPVLPGGPAGWGPRGHPPRPASTALGAQGRSRGIVRHGRDGVEASVVLVLVPTPAAMVLLRRP